MRKFMYESALDATVIDHKLMCRNGIRWVASRGNFFEKDFN